MASLSLACGLFMAVAVVAKPAGNDYVDSKVCVGCHSNVYRTYKLTGMARSFYRPTSEKSGEFYHKPTDAHYQMIQRNGRCYQRRWQIGFAGKETNIEEWSVDFVMGSGNHVRTYLHRTDRGALIELPLAWYSEKGGYWAMNPGYDSDHFIPPRKIAYECMFCHNAYPRYPSGHDESNAEPVYLDPLPEGIDCQRCHGPGGEHVHAATTPGQSIDVIRKAIVNPARLSPNRQMEVCMQCHLQTTASALPAAIRRYNRAPFSYRAGEPLGDFEIVFDRAGLRARDARFEIASAAYRLRDSRCFRESKGAMTCLTCHDPHNIPRGEAAATHYNSVCRQCHTSSFDKLVASAAHTKDGNCIGCHMPKRRTKDVVHAVMTDHWIQRRKPDRDLLADIPETHDTAQNAYHGEVVPYYPSPLPPTGENELYVAVAQVLHGSNFDSGIEQLSAALEKFKPRQPEFYFDLGEALRLKGELPKAIAAYEQALARDPNAPWTLRRLADAWKASDDPARATNILDRAVKADPEDARGWYELGAIHLDSGQIADAITAFQRSVTLDPDLTDAYNTLGSVFAQAGDVQRAKEYFSNALRIQPDNADAQSNLALLLASGGALEEAAYHFDLALRFKPDATLTRCNYAVDLFRLRRSDDAQAQLQLASKLDPQSPLPYDFVGNLIRENGRLDDAISAYQTALQLRPDFARAQFDLGTALAQKGDLAGAAAQLRQAAHSADPVISQRARQVLNQIGAK